MGKRLLARVIVAAAAVCLVSAFVTTAAAAGSVPPVPGNVTATVLNSTTIHVSWTDTSGGTAQFVVSNSQVSSPTLPTKTTGYNWGGLSPGTYMCFTITAKNASGQSPWSSYACATILTETSARNDLLQRIQGQPLLLFAGLHDNLGDTMDTAKIIQTGPGNYLAVYTTGFVVKLAGSTDLVNWTYLADLDPAASQPYLAEASNGAFVLVDEKQDSPGSSTSHLYFLHYPGLAALLSAQPDLTWHLSSRSERFFAGFGGLTCNEGTPDIHGMNSNGTTISFGFHYLSNCITGLDQEAFGKLTNFSTATATEDTVRDTAVNAIGYPGKHGGRDDITWQGYRFSLQEAQNSNADLGAYTTWRYVLYDYTNDQAYPASITSYVKSPCHGNPKITVITDTNGHPVILVTGYIFGGSQGCAASGEAGELLYTVSA